MYKVSLKAARVNAGLSQKAAAEALHISNKTLGSWEAGNTYPDADQVEQLCALYGAPYDCINFLPSNPL